MTTGNPQFERDFAAFLRGDDARLEALYRKLPQPEPDAPLDAAVRALAQRAAAATTRKPIASHRHWLPVFGVAAVVALAVGFAFRLGPQLWQRPSAVAPAEPAAESAPAPMALPEPAMESQAPAPAPAAKAAALDLQKVENAASRPAPRAFPPPARAMREAAPPAAEAKPSAAAPMRPERTDAQSAGAPAQSLAAPATMDSNATLYPEHWLANIRQMLRENRREAARRSLERFRKTYPDYRLPDDLRDLH